jgi:pyridoxine/pyridoxamine 5'-phosphate oxidase
VTSEELFSLIRGYRFGALASIGPDGSPQSALVRIAITPELEIVFNTVNTSRKYANLLARPACSFVIGGWGGSEQSVQYEGEAEELKAPLTERYQQTYFAAWPDAPKSMNWPDVAYFVVRPRWIRYSDFDLMGPQMIKLKF